MHLQLLPVLIFSLLFPFGRSLTPHQEALIDNVIEKYIVPESHIPGLGLSIVQDGETVLSKSYGKKDIANDLDADENTLYGIASISKSFTAVTIVKALSEKFPELGEHVLDTPIIKLAPNFNFTFSDRYRFQSVTFRDLLAHRTCLNVVDLQLVFHPLKTKSEYIYRTRYAEEVCAFRTNFTYSNSMYALAGEMIAHISNSSIEKMILDMMGELGMSGSSIIKSNGDFQHLPNMSKGYYRKQNQTKEFNPKLLTRTDYLLAAGGILTSPKDFAKYMSFHLNNGRVEDKQIIPEDVMKWLYKVSTPLDYMNDSKSGIYGYALGLLRSHLDNWQIIAHDGYWPPFSSQMTLVPGKKLGIFSTSNGPGFLPILHPTADHAVLHSAIWTILTDPDSYNQTEMLSGSCKKSQKFQFSRVNLDNPQIRHEETAVHRSDSDYVRNDINKIVRGVDLKDVAGMYGHPIYGDIYIIYRSDTSDLHFKYGEWGVGRLIRISASGNVFRIKFETDIDQHDYTFGPTLPEFHVDFPQSGELVFGLDNFKFRYHKNATLNTFPTIPWSQGSCAPEYN